MNKTELKYNVMDTGSYFFDRSSMKFFGDTMANYYVSANTVKIKTYSGDTHICYELTRKRPVKHGLCGPAYFDVNTFNRVLEAKPS